MNTDSQADFVFSHEFLIHQLDYMRGIENQVSQMLKKKKILHVYTSTLLLRMRKVRIVGYSI